MFDLIDPNREQRRKILLTQVDVPAAIPDLHRKDSLISQTSGGSTNNIKS